MEVSVSQDTRDAPAIVRAYHDAWTTKQFGPAIAMLSDEFRVEVPINGYPDKESFGQALTAFGEITERVTLLGEFYTTSEAALIYDMDVAKLGSIRVAEHFTVRDGRIVLLRQIHDTWALRQAGFAGTDA